MCTSLNSLFDTLCMCIYIYICTRMTIHECVYVYIYIQIYTQYMIFTHHFVYVAISVDLSGRPWRLHPGNPRAVRRRSGGADGCGALGAAGAGQYEGH